MSRRKIPAVALTAVALLSAAAAQDGPLAPRNLRVEHLSEPLGLDERRPRFSWEVDDPRRGAAQSAYEIVVVEDLAVPAAEAKAVWQSGKVLSRESFGVGYAGKPLHSVRRYAWRVRTWDGADRESPWSASARFGMGLLDPADWSAKWIGDASPPPPAATANNGFHSQFSPKEDDYKWVQIDLGQEKIFDGFRLHPARPYDWEDTPGFLFPAQFKIWVSGDPEFTENFQKVVDRTGLDVANPGAEPLEIPLVNLRYKLRYVRLGVLRMRRVEGRGCAFALAEMEVTSGGASVSRGCAVTASDSIETGPWSRSNLTDGDLVSHAAFGFEALPAPMLRKSFDLRSPVRRATLFASALGLYEIRINGSRVGDQELSPGWTDYRARVSFQDYDVGGLLRAGGNAIDVQLADGWYAGRLGLSWLDPRGPPRGIYGRRPRFLAQLEVELEDGTRAGVATDGTWRSATDGPLRIADLLDGETRDAGAESARWRATEVADEPAPALVAESCPPIRVFAELIPVALTEPSPGVFVFDLGRILAGRCRMKLAEPAGTTVTLRHGEALDEKGALYVANLRGASQTDRYTCRGTGDEVFEPAFTVHGFRYVEATGLSRRPDSTDLVARALGTDLREVSSFECSDPMLNRLWENILWTARANTMSVPTDCPQRDERLGWTGDIQVFAQTACFQRDMAALFRKWLRDLRDAQADDGRFPDFAPHPYGKDERFTGTPGWGDAGVFVPWVAWVNYGDRRMVEEQLDSMARWLWWIQSKNPDLVWRNARGNDYGDWLNGDRIDHEGWPKQGGEVPKDVLATAFRARSAQLVSRMSAAVGHSAEAERYRESFERIRAAFQKAFVAEDGTIQGDTQAGYALALAFDLLAPEQQALALARLKRNILEAYGGHLSTGFQSTARALIELSRRGEHELATAIATRTDLPSWGYMIENGATTIWERWDGFVPGRGFQDPGMNSFDHYAFGSIGEWMMRCLVGLEPDEDRPGWERFAIRPGPSSRISWARARHRTIRGEIACSWRTDGDAFRLDVTIPPNTSATVFVPCATERVEIAKSGEGPPVLHLRTENKTAVYDVPSGTYGFTSVWR